MSLERKVKNALDETRLLILGTQVLFGFQFNSFFQEGFAELPRSMQQLDCIGLVMMMTATGLLIAPAMQHRIIEGGQDTNRIHAATSTLAGIALLPIAVGLGVDVFIAFERVLGMRAGILAGAVFCALALLFWYGLEFLLKERSTTMTREEEKPTPLPTKVEQLLTEARVIIPGAQALLGFQLTVTLTRSFEQLAPSVRLIHLVALCGVALAIILLMAPAALHRISFNGEDSPRFLTIGSMFVILAPIPLALGTALDMYVAATRVSDDPMLALSLCIGTLVVLGGLWYAYPLWRRMQLREQGARAAASP
jgi:hypothetical protein